MKLVTIILWELTMVKKNLEEFRSF